MTFFSLHTSCVLTRGANKSCLIDLERAIYCSVPNELLNILEQKSNISINTIKQKHNKEDFSIIKQYLSFLNENKFLFFHLEHINPFIISNENFESPYNLEDIIVDVISPTNLNTVLSHIPNNIETLQIRMFYNPTADELKKIIENLRINGNTNIELIFNHNKYNSDSSYVNLYKNNKIISKIFIMDYGMNIHLLQSQVLGFEKEISSAKECGKISEKLFFPNMRTYLSAKSCNSCLNSKISIDVEGNIKNCPSMQNSFGNINNNSLEEVLNHKDFKKFWKITKDQIEVCKDCEFRYICTDCRAYIEDPNNEYSKPLKCGYDPYTNEWKKWSDNPLKQKAIKYFEMEELVK